MTPSEATVPPKRCNKPGIIYLAKNKVNGKCYVGQTGDDVKRRRIEHGNEAGRGSRFTFHSAIRKYGIKSFEFTVLQQCCGLECRNLAEQWWIAHLDCMVPKGYNLTGGGGARVFSQETLRKMSENMKRRMTPEYRKKISERVKSRIISAEQCENISKALKGKKKSPDQVRKMSETMKAKDISGTKNPFYGKTHSKETREKIAQVAIRNMTPERIEKMQKARKPASEETRKKISDKVKARGWVGERHPAYGRHHSEDSRRRMSEAQKGKIVSEVTRSKLSIAAMGNKGNTGRKFTEEHKKKIGEASRRNETWKHMFKSKCSGNNSQIALDFGHGGFRI